MATKAQVKATYIAQLQARYEFYTDGSRPLDMASKAADAALAVTMKLKGDAWEAALKECGLSPRITLKDLEALEA